jgi:hypothetical protein
MRITRGTWENLKVAPRSPVRSARVLHFNELVEKMSELARTDFIKTPRHCHLCADIASLFSESSESVSDAVSAFKYSNIIARILSLIPYAWIDGCGDLCIVGNSR